MNSELFITDVGSAVSIIVALALGFLVLLKGQKGNPANRIFFLISLCVAIWQTSYVLGINLSDPDLSRMVFMFNLATLPLVVLSLHLVLTVTGRIAKQRLLIWVLYGISAALCLFYIAKPAAFLLPSLPQLYLENFFVPGPLYYLQDFFFIGVTIYLFINLGIGYDRADHVGRNRLKYLIVAYIFAYGTSLVAEFLLYGIPVDPFVACLTGLYTIPTAYAIFKYDTIDLNIVAKRSFGYALAVAGTALFILLVSYTNNYVHAIFPDFPEWFTPLISAAVAVAIGIATWRKMRETDVLKYQFIDVVTHKFRTPLTHINWSAEMLRKNPPAEEQKEIVDTIVQAGAHLNELTDMLVGLSGSDEGQFLYAYTTENVSDVVKTIVAIALERQKEKPVTIENRIPEGLPLVHIDRKKVEFALQTILDNAMTYSPDHGKVTVSAEARKDSVIISVQDMGMGITKEDMPRLFTKFYRAKNAVLSYTEGMGIGLYLSRDMMRRQGGDMHAASEGPGKGSTFFLEMPIERSEA